MAGCELKNFLNIMIIEKKSISLMRLFRIYAAAGLGVVLCILLYDLCFKQRTSIFHESPAVYLIQGSVFLAAAFWAVSSINIDLKMAFKKASSNAGSDVKLAFKYFVIYILVISAIFSIIGSICLVLIKTDIIAFSKFTTFFNKPQAIGDGQRYFHDVLIKSPFKLVVYFFSTCILIPIEEEVFFRRLLYVSLRHKMIFWRSLFVSSLVFSAVHISGAVTALMAGLFLGWIYEKHQNLSVNIAVHGLINFAVTAIMIFSIL